MNSLPIRVLAAWLIVAAGIQPATANDPHGKHPAPKADAHDKSAKAPAPTDHAHDAPAAKDAHAEPAVTPDAAIRMLADGNARFTSGASVRPHQSQARLCETFADGQHPYAAVLSCADSRVPVELVFDAGIGDLFVVRVAGNVSDTDEIGTLEYGVEHLGITAILVLGHVKCGAVTAVVDKAHVTKNIAGLVDNIGPAADAAKKAFPQLTGPRLVAKAIRMNVHQSIADMVGHSELISERVKDGRLKIVGGVYDLHTGEVDWLEPSSTPLAATDHPSGTLLHDAKQGAPHPKDADPHSKDAHSPDDAHATTQESHTNAADQKKPDNYLVLGGLLGTGGLASWGLFHFIWNKPRAEVGEAPAE